MVKKYRPMLANLMVLWSHYLEREVAYSKETDADLKRHCQCQMARVLVDMLDELSTLQAKTLVLAHEVEKLT
jgi:hypothetical protein